MEARATIQFVVKAAVEVPYLSGLEYLSIIEQLAGMGLGGGIVFDAILVAAARKCKADNILTLNPTHFHRIWPDGRDKIIAP